ncbi:MAG TPA: hypothetical protein VK615_04900, partial [Candidatus Binatia bacterium]|nr:hypothetical protein [Candidatus Binatia bacterium]
LEHAKLFSLVTSTPICLIVLRSILGFTPSEWGYLATQRTNISVTQGFARTLDRKVRIEPAKRLATDGVAKERLGALITVACEILQKCCPKVSEKSIHRLDKADTKRGLESVQTMASMGAPYAMLLYERFLGRPFAGHRDSVSELIGDNLEGAVEEVLTRHGVSYRKTRRAERLPGFDQAPDFIVPDEFNPQIVIEAKLTEDDGTARDKVTRIQHLGQLSMAGVRNRRPKFEVIACIAGRGFGQRREDMKKMLLATRGKVFTLKTLRQLVDCSALKRFETKKPADSEVLPEIPAPEKPL